MTRYLPRSTPAVLLLVAALFLSAAGGAVAGGKITGKQIKNSTITHKDVKDGTLGTQDLSAAAKNALTYQLDYVVVSSPAQPVAAAASTTIQAACGSGYTVIGGSVVFEDPANGQVLGAGPVFSAGVAWSADVQNNGGAVQLVTVKAHCANLG